MCSSDLAISFRIGGRNSFTTVSLEFNHKHYIKINSINSIHEFVYMYFTCSNIIYGIITFSAISCVDSQSWEGSCGELNVRSLMVFDHKLYISITIINCIHVFVHMYLKVSRMI